MKTILAVLCILAVCAVPVGAGEIILAEDEWTLRFNPDEPVTNNISAVTLDNCLAIMEQAMREMDEYKIYGLGPTDERSNKAEQVWKHWQDAKQCWRKP